LSSPLPEAQRAAASHSGLSGAPIPLKNPLLLSKVPKPAVGRSYAGRQATPVLTPDAATQL
jgi:hypothetical protein